MNWNHGIGNLQPFYVHGEDGDAIIRNRLRALGRWKEPNTVQEQKNELSKYLKSKKSKGYRIDSYVMLDMPEKGTEKGHSIKVSILKSCFY